MLRMLNNKIMLKRSIAAVEKDGLIYTDDQSTKSFEGTVVAIPDNSPVKIGDVVIFGEFDGADIVYENSKYMIIQSESLWGVK